MHVTRYVSLEIIYAAGQAGRVVRKSDGSTGGVRITLRERVHQLFSRRFRNSALAAHSAVIPRTGELAASWKHRLAREIGKKKLANLVRILETEKPLTDGQTGGRPADLQ